MTPKHIPLLMMTLVLAVSGCKESPHAVTVKQSLEVMGTLAEVTVVATNSQTAQAAIEAAYTRLEDVNRLMSDYLNDSEIGRLNKLPAGERLAVSSETFAVLKKAREISLLSGGAFDITCRPLVELWKRAGKKNKLPDRAAIKKTLARVGFNKLQWDEPTRNISFTVENMQIDLGGIAKGYALDLAAQALKKAGISSGLIDLGGDVLAIGSQADGRTWRIGIQHPFQKGLIAKLALIDRTVATSGNQQRFFIIEGNKYSHIIDPRSGWPAVQATSVTVIAPHGITADTWATAFSILTVEQGKLLAGKLPNLGVMWVWKSAEKMQIAKTSGFNQYVIE